MFHYRFDALDEADTIVTTILNKSFFWQKASAVPMTERQTQMLNLFLDWWPKYRRLHSRNIRGMVLRSAIIAL